MCIKSISSWMIKISAAPTDDFLEMGSPVAWISLVEMFLFSKAASQSKSKEDRMPSCNNYHGL